MHPIKINKIVNTLLILFILVVTSSNSFSTTCTYQLEMEDDYGDGWQGEVKIEKNCGSGWVDVITWQSESGFGPTTIPFTVDDADGCSYRLTYRDNGGWYPYEEFFDLYDANGTLIIDGDGSDASIQNIPFTPSCGAPTCSDGIQNQGETGVDCGGPCAACPPSCSDGIQNQGETGIDCGGPCSACVVGNSCAALGFDDVAATFTGTHSVWTTMRGRNNVAGPFTIEGPIINEPIISSQFNEYHDLRPGSDPSAGFCYFPDGTIPVPNGSQNVMRLGAYQQIGSDASGMTTTFTVTEPYLVYYYILGFENTGHTANDRGFATFEIRDNGGTVLPCGSFEVYENGPTESWTYNTTSNPVWLMDDWRTVTMDVSSYIGQALTLEVWVADCQQGAHSGFGYFDFECLSSATPDCSVLPIDLLEFKTECNVGNPKLTWTTSSEINNDYFTIERSTDAVNFEAVGTVSGNGNSYTQINYSWTDDNPINRAAYYRLKQTDFNGAFEYHGVRTVTCEQDGGISIYPNPFTNSFTVQLSENMIYPTTVEVIDCLGRKVYTQIIKSAITEISLDAKIAKGTYFVKVFNETTQIVERILKTN
jgi:hypothetical protein